MNFSDRLFNREDEPAVPSYPFYGYDNAEELDKDVDYMKSLCSRMLKMIQLEVDEECDKLEYDGSCMFDAFPDQVHLGAIIDTIHERLADMNWEQMPNSSGFSMEIEQIGGPGYRQPPPCRGSNCPPPPPPPRPCRGPYCPPPRPSRPPHPPRPDHRPDGRPDFLRDLISSLLYNEMIHRRRRHRSRKRWNER